MSDECGTPLQRGKNSVKMALILLYLDQNTFCGCRGTEPRVTLSEDSIILFLSDIALNHDTFLHKGALPHLFQTTSSGARGGVNRRAKAPMALTHAVLLVPSFHGCVALAIEGPVKLHSSYAVTRSNLTHGLSPWHFNRCVVRCRSKSFSKLMGI